MAELDHQNKDQQAEQDPIARLHKMSTTAGVAAQDYVAINTLAVTAAVLGVASALSLMGTYFLVIGLAAIGCGVMALRKIADSNGTEGGRPLAWAGILISVLVAAVIIFNAVSTARAEEAERAHIRQAISQFGQHLVNGEYDKAYALCDPAFRQNWTLDQFRGTWQIWQDANRGFGPIRGMKDNGIISFPTSSSDRPIAWTKVRTSFRDLAEYRISTEFAKGDDGQWHITLMKEPFPPERR